MSTTKGQVLSLCEELKDKIVELDKLLGLCEARCASVSRIYGLAEDIENSVNGLVVYDPYYNSDDGEDYDPAELDP